MSVLIILDYVYRLSHAEKSHVEIVYASNRNQVPSVNLDLKDRYFILLISLVKTKLSRL